MRIRPAVITGAGTLIALAAIATVVFATTPDDAGPALVALLWAAVFLAAWGILTTLLLVMRQSVPQALWTAVFPAVSALGLLKAFQNGVLTRRLLVGTVLATLVVSSFIRWRLRRTPRHG